MAGYLINSLENYLSPNTIPLYVEEVAQGKHPARHFHGHTFMEIVLILSGSGLHLVGEAAAEITAGDVLLVYPGMSHGYDRTETLGLVNVVYDPVRLSLPQLDGGMMPLFQRFLTSRTALPAQKIVLPLLHLTQPERLRTARRIGRLAAELTSSRPGRKFLGLALFMEVITELCRSERAAASGEDVAYLVGNAIRYMHTHLQDAITVGELAEQVNMSRRNFFRRFHNATGSSPVEYLKGLRFANAQDLLAHTDLSVGEVAYRSGFCNGNYLSRLFRERLNLSPREFRASVKAAGSASRSTAPSAAPPK